MKTILYLLGGVAAAPGILLAYVIWMVTDAFRQESFFKFLVRVIELIGSSLELLFLVIVPASIVWVTLAFLPSYRWIGALLVAMVTTVSMVEFFAASREAFEPDHLFFPAMSFLGLALNLWLMWDGLPPNSLTGWSTKKI